MRPSTRPKVILRHCDSYDPERIRRIVREGMAELGLRPRGRTLLKPNLVASGPLFEHAFTRPEFTEGVLMALRDRDEGQMTELRVGERCGITVPSRFAFEGAGYPAMLDRVGVKPCYFEEEQQVEIRYDHPERLRDYVFTPEAVALTDFFVNCPKFKAHPWTTVTFSIKAYIGIQDDRHRLIDHDHRLNEKIADLQHIVQPELICIDAITAGEGRMLTPIPRDLNLIVIGNNQVAFDSVCCAIIGVDPKTVDHIRITSERGFGSMDLDSIEISGDVTLDEARKRAEGFKVGLIRVEKYFEGTHITAYAGPPPEPEHTQYCWGGCPGAIEEAIEILRLYDAECDQKMPRMHVVFGAYDGPIDAKPGEKVVFIGDCATFDGEVAGKPVQIRSKYRDRALKDPHVAKHDDIYVKMAKVTRKLASASDDQVVRFEGCPVSVAEQALALVRLGGLKNPYLSADNALAFTKNYLMWRSTAMAKRLTGTPYQRPGVSARGEARPELAAGEPAE
ncbi:MAG: DUF362 domain-containing protein [Polyangiaceae bacterium]|nr:DUF362 domain-containing protein [Polyangiaceae bacterium]